MDKDVSRTSGQHAARRAPVRKRVFSRLVAATLMLAAGTAGASVSAAQRDSDIGLGDCRLTVQFLEESDGQRMYREGWLPKAQTLAEGFAYGPGSASLLVWVFACEHVSINGARAGAAMLSLTGIQIEDDLVRSHSAATHWDTYLVWAHTDNAALAKVLRSAKLPAFTVPHMRFNWRANGDTTTVTVPWSKSPYELSVKGRVPDAPHLHDNTFQHGAQPGVGPRLELVIDPLVPRDKSCLPQVMADCTNVSTKRGGRMGKFLGSATYFIAADHEAIPYARIKVVRG